MGNLLKGITVFVLFFFVTICLPAQRIDTAWTRTFGGTGYDYGHSVQQTTDKGYIVAGDSNVYGLEGGGDVYLIKTDSLGYAIWTKTFGDIGNDYGYSVQQTTDGGYIVVGQKAPDDTADHTNNYVYLIKTNLTGDTLWTRTFGGTGHDYGNSVQQTTDGGYIVAGVTYSFGAGRADVYLIKTNSLGETLWTKTFGGSELDHGYSVRQTDDDGYIVAGRTHSFGAGDWDVYLIKTDSLGDTLWTKTYGDANWNVSYSVQQTDDGGYIIAGYTKAAGHLNYDCYLIKTNPLGDTLWTKTYGRDRSDHGYSVQQTTDGGYILAGTSYIPDSAYDCVWVIKTNHSGDIMWEKVYASTDGNRRNFVQQTEDGGYIIAGSKTGNHFDVYLIKIELFPEIIVTSPNGGEEWQSDSTYDITWTSYQTSGAVKIEYSLNNGVDWTEIIGSAPDDGSHPWTIPDTMSYNCLVRISDTNGSLSDISNSVFTICSEPFIIVISPNGGEIWSVDSTYNITWASAGTSGEVRIEYSINNGYDWETIADRILDEETYGWLIPNTTSDSCLVRVTDLDGSPADTSDAVFRIVSFITVISPNGGEEWYNEDYHNITWMSAGTSGGVKIEYSINNGLDWAEIIASTPDSGFYLWNPPDTVSDSCLVSISDTNGSVSDISDSVFSIIPGSGVPIGSLEVYSLDVKAIVTGNQIEFTYTLPERASDIKFTLYNVVGLKIKEEKIKESPAGFYSGKINLKGVSKGIYFIRMEVNGGKFIQTRKFLLM